ncbi:t(6)A37 threonylcarbamoyladenosine biosynthesis protein RimN [Bacteroidales bacterium Barb6]|nr:t(6)A37 threonylcarbamoyladenosine biosynthesis protein RimN [Bacteroidales bacterium Barb6]OAV68936.1 t(6)A37 threonylcarbamoyladenosine biosynthesis protein RimN [Bacteroidales bacterium Barb4]
MNKTITEDIKKACEVLRAGGLILYPTDTIWGIGCDATNDEAVQKVYDLKRRTDRKAMLVLTDSPDELETYVPDVPAVTHDLIEAADKPLTIIFSGSKNLSKLLAAEDGSIGIRVTREEFSRRLCEQFRKPIVSTSANVSGEVFPSFFSEISETIKDGVDYIVHYRRGDTGETQPSSIIKLGEGGVFKLIR